MCDPVTIAIGSALATAVAGAASYESGKKSQALQKEGLQLAEANAKATATAADEAKNAATAQMPNTAAIMDQNKLTAQGGNPVAGTGPTAGVKGGGAGGTMLTSPAGVDPAALNLSKNTLLGS